MGLRDKGNAARKMKRDSSGVADAVDFDGGAPVAEADVAPRRDRGVVGLQPTMKAEKTAQCAEGAGFVCAVRPEPLQLLSELRVGCGP